MISPLLSCPFWSVRLLCGAHGRFFYANSGRKVPKFKFSRWHGDKWMCKGLVAWRPNEGQFNWKNINGKLLNVNDNYLSEKVFAGSYVQRTGEEYNKNGRRYYWPTLGMFMPPETGWLFLFEHGNSAVQWHDTECETPTLGWYPGQPPSKRQK